MANKDAILDKIVRNMNQRGFGAGASRVGDTVEFVKAAATGDTIVVSYVDKAGDAPQIGVGLVDANSTTVLGLGNVTAGSIKIKGAAAETTIALILDDADAITLMAVCTAFANDVVIERGDNTTELARIAGHADVLGLGE